MGYLIGVDGGGSKTNALIARPDGTILGRGESGSSNYRAVGIDRTCEALDQALRAAYAQAGLPPDPRQVLMACFGLAGVDRPKDEDPLRTWAARHWPGMPVMFVSDARLVLAAGTPQGWGIGVICGTGSIVYGRNSRGQTARAGGWGYLLGDEGSGYDIGRSALRCVAKAADGRGPQTALTGHILAHWSLEKAQNLIGFVYRPEVSKTEIAALAVLVEHAALQDDPVAQGILQAAGSELATAAKVVVSRLGLSEAIPCALVGGVLVNGRLMTQEFLSSASEQGLELDPIQFVTEPALGAIRLAGESSP
jgi:N-acetylglucosamine kinase-like BadF-type ATPase